MFNLAQKINNIVGNTVFHRWRAYFVNNYIKNLEIYDDWDYIKISADVMGNDEYYTSIWIDKKWHLRLSCSCPAYDNSWDCKHLAWLAIEVESKYMITDELEFIDKKTSKKLNLDMSDYNEEDFEEQDNYEDEYYNKWIIKHDEFPWNPWLDPKIYEQLKKNPELLKLFWLKNITSNGLNVNHDKESNKLSIFSQISNNQYIQDARQEKEIYNVKLEFIEKSWKIQDIKLFLYRMKMQKNWKLSSWAQIKRELLNEAPSEFRMLSPYLESRNTKSYYWSYADDFITFNSAPKNFIQTVFEFDEIFDKNNQKLNIEKEIFELKIEVKKENDGYKIYLKLTWKNSCKTLIWCRIFWTIWANHFGCLFSNNDLVFFKSELSYNFIRELSKKELILNLQEFEELKKKKEFQTVIENVSDINELWIDYEDIEPQFKLKIEISSDYSSVKVEKVLTYDDIEIWLKDSEKIMIIHENRIIKRNKGKEIEILKISWDLNKLFDKSNENIWKKYCDDNIDSFFDEIEKLIAMWIKAEYKQEAKRVSNTNLKINLKVSSWIDFFDIESNIMLWDKEIQDAKEILSQIQRWARYITLDNGNIVILKNDITKEINNLEALWMNMKDIWKEIKVWKYNIWLLRENNEKTSNLIFDLAKDIIDLKNKIKDFKHIEKVKLPTSSKINLREYQKTWVDFINFLEQYHFSWILADDMWLWKTIQTLAFLEYKYSQKNKMWRTLIICPTSIVLNWLDEATKFTPQLRVEYLKDSKIGISAIKEDTQIIIVSYWIMANIVDSWNLKEIFEYIILDEAQNIKNPVALRTKAICELQWKNRLALSWTPIENNLMELWSIFNFLMPWFLWNLSNFKSNYASADKEVLDILSRKVKPFILRRTKEKVLKDLPPKVEEYINLEMNEKQKAFYDKLKNTFKVQIEKKLEEEGGFNKNRFEVLDALLKLRQACLMPALVSIEWNNIKDSIKLQYIDENIEEMIGKWHNLLIFSQFTWFLAYVQELLNKKWIRFNYLDGKTNIKERKRLVDSFNTWNVNVFIISLKAWWTWLNLTSADYVIHLDPWWNPAVENQATDRAHRMWQTKTVFVQKLIVKDSIEEKILKLQDNKKKLIDDVFSGNFSWKLEKSDIDFIFS